MQTYIHKYYVFIYVLTSYISVHAYMYASMGEYIWLFI